MNMASGRAINPASSADILMYAWFNDGTGSDQFEWGEDMMGVKQKLRSHYGLIYVVYNGIRRVLTPPRWVCHRLSRHVCGSKVGTLGPCGTLYYLVILLCPVQIQSSIRYILGVKQIGVTWDLIKG